MDALLVIGRNRWEVDNCLIHGDPIYDTNSEHPMVEFSYLMYLGKPKVMEVRHTFPLFNENPYPSFLG